MHCKNCCDDYADNVGDNDDDDDDDNDDFDNTTATNDDYDDYDDNNYDDNEGHNYDDDDDDEVVALFFEAWWSQRPDNSPPQETGVLYGLQILFRKVGLSMCVLNKCFGLRLMMIDCILSYFPTQNAVVSNYEDSYYNTRWCTPSHNY